MTSILRPKPPAPVGRKAPSIPKPKPPKGVMKPSAQKTPGIVDNPKSYQKRHPNAILRKVKGGAKVIGRRTSQGKMLKAPMVPMPRPPRMY